MHEVKTYRIEKKTTRVPEVGHYTFGKSVLLKNDRLLDEIIREIR